MPASAHPLCTTARAVTATRALCAAAIAIVALAFPPRTRAESFVHPHLTIHGGAAVPLGALAARTAPLGGVFGGGGLFSMGSVPVYLGVDVAGLFMISESTERPLPGSVRLTLGTTTQPRAVLAHLVLRVQGPWGTVQPYLEGRVGLKHFRTRTTIELGGNVDSVVLDDDSRPSATALSGGVGVGVEFVSADRKEGESDGRSASGGLSISVHWLPGGAATFSEADIVGPEDDATPRRVQLRTRTDILMITLAIRAEL